MAKKKINSYEEFIKAAVELAHNDVFSKTKEEWDQLVQERYDNGVDADGYRIRDFANNELLDKTGNSSGIFNLMRRLDDIIESENDPSMKARAMAVRHAAFPLLEEIAESRIIDSVDKFYDEVIEKYDVPDKVRAEYLSKRQNSINVLKGVPGIGARLNSPRIRHYEELNANEKLGVLSTLIRSFSDRRACLDRRGNLLELTVAMGDVLRSVGEAGHDMGATLLKLKDYNFTPVDETEKKDFEALKSLCKNKTLDELDSIGSYAENCTLKSLSEMNITPKRTHANLVLEKNPIVDITANSFMDKQSKGELSPAETEWGESNIDNMLRNLYTDNELRALKRAGIDPASGIYVDGEPVDWDRNVSTRDNANPSSLQQDALKKCAIIAKALNGAKIDVCRIVPDGKGGFRSGAPIPVKTDFSMKTEKRSFLTFLKNLFHIELSLKDKIKTANKETRNYSDYIAPTDPALAEKRAEARRKEEEAKVNTDKEVKEITIDQLIDEEKAVKEEKTKTETKALDKGSIIDIDDISEIDEMPDIDEILSKDDISDISVMPDIDEILNKDEALNKDDILDIDDILGKDKSEPINTLQKKEPEKALNMGGMSK